MFASAVLDVSVRPWRQACCAHTTSAESTLMACLMTSLLLRVPHTPRTSMPTTWCISTCASFLERRVVPPPFRLSLRANWLPSWPRHFLARLRRAATACSRLSLLQPHRSLGIRASCLLSMNGMPCFARPSMTLPPRRHSSASCVICSRTSPMLRLPT